VQLPLIVGKHRAVIAILEKENISQAPELKLVVRRQVNSLALDKGRREV